MNIRLNYGESGITVDVPEGSSILGPTHVPALANEEAGFIGALNNPVDSPALSRLLKPDVRICIVFTDITRPTPNHRIIPWLLAYLERHGVPDSQIVLLSATGTHRPNTTKELKRLLTPAVVARYRVLNHQCDRVQDLVNIGNSRLGTPLWINRHYLEANLRIVTGFIEPHFFAGFSGGPKGIVPGLAGLETVMTNHGHRHIASENATFGTLRGNPLWEDLFDMARMAGRCFLLNVTLNRERHITGVFAGELLSAHSRGCEFVRRSAMLTFDAPFDVVVTSNNGYPLDQNLYQAVKGMTAASRIVKPGGLIVMAAECRDGVPAGSPFETLLHQAGRIDALARHLATPGFCHAEQWQAQIMAKVLVKARVHLFSSLEANTVRRAHLIPCDNISDLLRMESTRLGRAPRVAVIPEGPMVIPYLANP